VKPVCVFDKLLQKIHNKKIDFFSFYFGASDQIGSRSPHCWGLLITTQLKKHTHPMGLPWMYDNPVDKAATYTAQNKHNTPKSMSSAGFEIPAIERP